MYQVWIEDLWSDTGKAWVNRGSFPCASDAIRALSDMLCVRAEIRRVTDLGGNPITPRVVVTYNH